MLTKMKKRKLLDDPPVEPTTSSSKKICLPGLKDLFRLRGFDFPTFPPVSSSSSSVNEKEKQGGNVPWPNANEYFELLTNRPDSIPVYELGVDNRGVSFHPSFIYDQPVACMYLLKCRALTGKGSFGFPRHPTLTNSTTKRKKKFTWRKMSFITSLPKNQPLVDYVTATCYHPNADNNNNSKNRGDKVFRMHAVMLRQTPEQQQQQQEEKEGYVLVHIRAGGQKQVGARCMKQRKEGEQSITWRSELAHSANQNNQNGPVVASPTTTVVRPPTITPPAMNLMTDFRRKIRKMIEVSTSGTPENICQMTTIIQEELKDFLYKQPTHL